MGRYSLSCGPMCDGLYFLLLILSEDRHSLYLGRYVSDVGPSERVCSLSRTLVTFENRRDSRSRYGSVVGSWECSHLLKIRCQAIHIIMELIILEYMIKRRMELRKSLRYVRSDSMLSIKNYKISWAFPIESVWLRRGLIWYCSLFLNSA